MKRFVFKRHSESCAAFACAILQKRKALADTNGDGVITVVDATQIQKYVAKLITELG